MEGDIYCAVLDSTFRKESPEEHKDVRFHSDENTDVRYCPNSTFLDGKYCCNVINGAECPLNIHVPAILRDKQRPDVQPPQGVTRLGDSERREGDREKWAIGHNPWTQ